MKLLSVLLRMGLLLAPSLVFSQEITRGTFNDSTYIAMLAPNGITWNAAEASAVSMGGHLASISSASEDHFVYSLASSSSQLWVREGGNPSGPGLGPWVGGFLITGGWAWSDGTAFTYSNWAAGEPNNYGGTEDRIMFLSNVGTLMNDAWNDYPNDVTGDPIHLGPNLHGYIVEIVPEPASALLFLIGWAAFAVSRRKSA